MASHTRVRLLRGLPLLLAVGAVGSCAAGSDVPSLDEARAAGQEYGQAIVETVGESATREEMRALCGAAARDEALLSAEGHDADEGVDAFIDACVEAVSDAQ